MVENRSILSKMIRGYLQKTENGYIIFT